MTQHLSFKANPGKKLKIRVNNKSYIRYPVKTHVITPSDNIIDVVIKYSVPFLKDDDILIISERIVAITQGRTTPAQNIKVSFTASSFILLLYKPFGIGMKYPEKMEMAIREAGLLRIFVGALIAAFTKPFGVKGLFYKFVGHQINAIDGPTNYSLPPYNRYVTLGPKDPVKVANTIKNSVRKKGRNVEVVIIDANDLGVRVEGATEKINMKHVCDIFKDNPIGQGIEQTPLAIVRQIS